MYSLALLTMGSLTAWAQQTPTDRVDIRLADQQAQLSATVLASAFPKADEDRDGQLSGEEVSTHRAAILAAVDMQVRLRNEDGTVATPTFSSVSVPNNRSDTLRLTLRYDWSTPPETVHLEYGLFSMDNQRAMLMVVDEDVNQRRLTAIHHGDEAITLRGAPKARKASVTPTLFALSLCMLLGASLFQRRQDPHPLFP